MPENISEDKNLAEFEAIIKRDEKREKIKNKIRKLIGVMSLTLAIFLIWFVIQDDSIEGIMGGLMLLFLAPIILILMLINIIWSIFNIKKLDKVSWFLFILNLMVPFFFFFSAQYF